MRTAGFWALLMAPSFIFVQPASAQTFPVTNAAWRCEPDYREEAHQVWARRCALNWPMHVCAVYLRADGSARIMVYADAKYWDTVRGKVEIVLGRGDVVSVTTSYARADQPLVPLAWVQAYCVGDARNNANRHQEMVNKAVWLLSAQSN